MAKIYRFTFKKKVKREFIELCVAIAVIAVESLFGMPKVRLSASYAAFESRIVLEVVGKVGAYVLEVFMGLMNRFVGERNYRVEEVKKNESR